MYSHLMWMTGNEIKFVLNFQNSLFNHFSCWKCIFAFMWESHTNPNRKKSVPINLCAHNRNKNIAKAKILNQNTNRWDLYFTLQLTRCVIFQLLFTITRSWTSTIYIYLYTYISTWMKAFVCICRLSRLKFTLKWKKRLRENEKEWEK